MVRIQDEDGSGVMDHATLRRMLEEHHASAWGWALHCCRGDRNEAQEVLQTAYLQILAKGAATFDGLSSFKTWLFAVVRKTAGRRRFQLLRRLRRLGATPDTLEVSGAAVEDEVYFTELRRRIEGMLEHLSERQREVLHLVFYQELTVEEAAAVMGVSVGSARTHYHRGKDRLRSQLQEAGLDHGQTGRRIENQRVL